MISPRLIGIIACIATTTMVTITLGIAWPFLAIVLESQGVPAWLNGLNASTQMLAVLVVAPIGPRIIGRLGAIRVMALGLVGMAASLLALTVFPNVWAWFPLRFVFGFFAELAFLVGDLWINHLAVEKSRGRIIGVFGMFLHGGFAVGPLLIEWLGTRGWLVLYVGAGVIFVALVPLYFARGVAPVVERRHRARILHYMRIAPTLVVAGLMFGLIDSATLSLLPVYGMDKGLAVADAAFLLTMFVAGGVLGQLPIGWLADHMDRRKLLAWCAAVMIAALGALPFSFGSHLLTWLVLLTMGVTLGSFYLLALAMMGARFTGADFVSVNASMLLAWGLGMVVGPAISGTAMQAMGPEGMPFVSAALAAVFLLFILRRMRTAPDTA